MAEAGCKRPGTTGAVFRTGVWGGKNGTLWLHYQTMTKAIHRASDHAAIYADINPLAGARTKAKVSLRVRASANARGVAG